MNNQINWVTSRWINTLAASLLIQVPTGKQPQYGMMAIGPNGPNSDYFRWESKLIPNKFPQSIIILIDDLPKIMAQAQLLRGKGSFPAFVPNSNNIRTTTKKNKNYDKCQQWLWSTIRERCLSIWVQPLLFWQENTNTQAKSSRGSYKWLN